MNTATQGVLFLVATHTRPAPPPPRWAVCEDADADEYGLLTDEPTNPGDLAITGHDLEELADLWAEDHWLIDLWTDTQHAPGEWPEDDHARGIDLHITLLGDLDEAHQDAA